jgi:hypothetical protein
MLCVAVTQLLGEGRLVTDGDKHCAACPVDRLTGFVFAVNVGVSGAASGCVVNICYCVLQNNRYLDSVRSACSILMCYGGLKWPKLIY